MYSLIQNDDRTHDARQFRQFRSSSGANSFSYTMYLSPGRPDMTFTVDWALTANYHSIYLSPMLLAVILKKT